MRETAYLFRREDTGEIIEVDFDTMMSHRNGILALAIEGKKVVARRIEKSDPTKVKPVSMGVRGFELVSDAMGFVGSQLESFEADRKLSGFSGVEFTRDPQVPGFYQARFKSRKEWARYVKHRGLTDRNGTSGGSCQLTKLGLEQARARVLKQYPLNRS